MTKRREQLLAALRHYGFDIAYFENGPIGVRIDCILTPNRVVEFIRLTQVLADHEPYSIAVDGTGSNWFVSITLQLSLDKVDE